MIATALATAIAKDIAITIAIAIAILTARGMIGVQQYLFLPSQTMVVTD